MSKKPTDEMSKRKDTVIKAMADSLHFCKLDKLPPGEGFNSYIKLHELYSFCSMYRDHYSLEKISRTLGWIQNALISSKCATEDDIAGVNKVHFYGERW